MTTMALLHPDNEIPYLPVRTVVKFYDNHEPTNSNKLMTKTLLKAGFIDNDWLDQANAPGSKMDVPRDGEFWLVDVVHETCPAQPKGCFLLHPIRRIESNSLNRLLPGMYRERNYEGCMVLEPKMISGEQGEINWLLPLRHKKVIKDIYAIIVVH